MSITIPRGTKVWSSETGHYRFLYPSSNSFVTEKDLIAQPKYFTGGAGKEAYQLETGAIVWLEDIHET